MKKMYRIKVEQGGVMTVIANMYRIDERGILHVFNRHYVAREDDIVEEVFSATGGRWWWIREVREVE